MGRTGWVRLSLSCLKTRLEIDHGATTHRLTTHRCHRVGPGHPIQPRLVMKLFLALILTICTSALADEVETIVGLIRQFHTDRVNYTQVLDLSGQVLPTVEVAMEKTVSGITAECHKWEDGTRRLVFNPYMWAKLDSGQHQWVVYHELGHCMLDREHTETGIMKPNCGDVGEFEASKDRLLSGLFN